MHTRPWRRGALLALALAAPAGLVAQTPTPQAAPAGPPLSLEQAVAAAREQNPEMLQQRNDIRSSRAAVRAARLDFLPSANASAQLGYTGAGEARFGSVQLRSEEPATYSSSYSYGLNYRLDGQKLMQPRIARAQQEATAERIEGYEANLVSQVVQQYLTGLQALEQVGQAEREVARTREHERLARARMEVGAGTPLDLRRAEVQRGQAEVAFLQRQNDYRIEVLRLGRQMGAPLPPDTRLTTTFALSEPRWSADSLVAQALANNPDLDAARASARAARTTVRAARTQYLPSLSFDLGWSGFVSSDGTSFNEALNQSVASAQNSFANCQRDNALSALVGAGQESCARFDTSDPAVMDRIRSGARALSPAYPFGWRKQPVTARMSVSLPLFNGYQRERQIEESRVQAQDAELAVRTRELALRTDITAALLSLQTAFRTAQLQEQVVEKAGEELRLAQERFRFGVASSVEVTDAQTSLAESERARIDAVYNYHKSLAALEALIGEPLR